MLSTSAEYALRIMAYISLQAGRRSIRANELSKDVHVPRAYLSKILRRLVVSGILTATKGHGGGFTLAKPPSKIRIWHVIVSIDEDYLHPRCVFGWSACSDSKPCVLHQEWKKARNSFLKWAHKTTLASLRPKGSKYDIETQVNKLLKMHINEKQ